MKLAALLLTAALTGQSGAAWAAGSKPDSEAVHAFLDGGTDVTATAYTSGPESTGKRPGHPQYGLTFTGTRARQGHTIAVDPRHIPLGSLVYIAELQEYRVAEDIGGAIVGRKIDLYMDRLSDARNWGVRKVRIQVFPRI